MFELMFYHISTELDSLWGIKFLICVKIVCITFSRIDFGQMFHKCYIDSRIDVSSKFNRLCIHASLQYRSLRILFFKRRYYVMHPKSSFHFVIKTLVILLSTLFLIITFCNESLISLGIVLHSIIEAC